MDIRKALLFDAYGKPIQSAEPSINQPARAVDEAHGNTESPQERPPTIAIRTISAPQDTADRAQDGSASTGEQGPSTPPTGRTWRMFFTNHWKDILGIII